MTDVKNVRFLKQYVKLTLLIFLNMNEDVPWNKQKQSEKAALVAMVVN